jgi:hypothetical protein
MSRATIAALNDSFRRTLEGGRVLITASVSALPPVLVAEVLERVRTFSDFTSDNDPYGEHDFGSFELAAHKFFWKIDYYDKSMAYGSEDPADPERTTRVLTIMLAEDY